MAEQQIRFDVAEVSGVVRSFASIPQTCLTGDKPADGGDAQLVPGFPIATGAFPTIWRQREVCSVFARTLRPGKFYASHDRCGQSNFVAGDGARVAISIRTGANFVPLTLLGIPIQYYSRWMQALPGLVREDIASAASNAVERLRGGHTCAVTMEGHLKYWGNNFSGQLGRRVSTLGEHPLLGQNLVS